MKRYKKDEKSRMGIFSPEEERAEEGLIPEPCQGGGSEQWVHAKEGRVPAAEDGSNSAKSSGLLF